MDGINIEMNQISLLVAFLALFIAYLSLRYNKLMLLHSLLTDKAKECNQYYIDFLFNLISSTNERGFIRAGSKSEFHYSGMVSTIIVTEELLKLYKSRLDKVLCINKSKLLDQYYLSLHTSIRIELSNTPERKFDSKISVILKDQLNRCKSFLKDCIAKDLNKDYEQRNTNI